MKKPFLHIRLTAIIVTLPIVLSAQIIYKDFNRAGSDTTTKANVITREDLLKATDTGIGQRFRTMNVRHLENVNENNIAQHLNGLGPDTLRRRKMIRSDSLLQKRTNSINQKSTTAKQQNVQSPFRGWHKSSADE